MAVELSRFFIGKQERTARPLWSRPKYFYGFIAFIFISAFLSPLLVAVTVISPVSPVDCTMTCAKPLNNVRFHVGADVRI